MAAPDPMPWGKALQSAGVTLVVAPILYWMIMVATGEASTVALRSYLYIGIFAALGSLIGSYILHTQGNDRS